MTDLQNDQFLTCLFISMSLVICGFPSCPIHSSDTTSSLSYAEHIIYEAVIHHRVDKNFLIYNKIFLYNLNNE